MSAVDNRVYVFGGELEPRKPRDNDLFAVDVDAAQGDLYQAVQQGQSL